MISRLFFLRCFFLCFLLWLPVCPLHPTPEQGSQGPFECGVTQTKQASNTHRKRELPYNVVVASSTNQTTPPQQQQQQQLEHPIMHDGLGAAGEVVVSARHCLRPPNMKCRYKVAYLAQEPTYKKDRKLAVSEPEGCGLRRDPAPRHHTPSFVCFI